LGEGGLRGLLAAVSVAGLAVSLYLTWVYAAGAAPVCAGDGQGCETVQSSPYSSLLGVPITALGLLGYAGLLVSAAFRGFIVALSGLFLALLGTLFSGYLTWLELFVIEAICQWCVASAALMAVALVLAALRLRYG
jgi:uncharacterized membrane protein